MRRFNHISVFCRVTAALASWMMLTSCFTGIEGTKTITMSKEERQLAERTPEEKLLDNVKGDSLQNWRVGKPFIVADERASVLLVPASGSASVADIVGDTIYYAGNFDDTGLSGENELNLVFTSKNGADRYTYNVRQAMGQNGKEGAHSVFSDRIPMLIDVETVDKISCVISGRRVYLLSADWIGEEGHRFKGKKFVEARINKVSAGNMVFPVRVDFECVSSPHEQSQGSYMMNYSDEKGGSRSFASLFSLTDPRKRYPQITDNMWVSICDSRVVPGMTKEECRLALGAPSDVNAGRDYSHTLDIWQYADGTVLFFEDGLLTGTRVGGD